VVQVIRIYIVTRFPEANRVLPVDGRLFGELLAWQAFFTMFITIFGGAGLVANDLRTGAILVYLSRPLTRRDYVVGKLGVLLALNLSATLARAVRRGPRPRPRPLLEMGTGLDRARRRRPVARDLPRDGPRRPRGVV